MLFLSVMLGQRALADETWHFWLDQAADAKVSDKTTIRAGQSFRYSYNDGKLSTYFLEAGGGRQVASWLDVGAAWRQQYDRREGHWFEENRPYGEATFRWKTRLTTLSDRNRLEYRFLEDQKNISRYRNKLTVQINPMGGGFELKPYVAAEAFVDESARLKNRDRTRLTLGVRKDVMSRALTLDGYVSKDRVKKSDRWSDNYIAGFQLGFHY